MVEKYGINKSIDPTTEIDGNPVGCYIPGTECYCLRKLFHNTHRSIGP